MDRDAAKEVEMTDMTKDQLKEAHRALLSALHKCEKIDTAKLPVSQRTLLERRIDALQIALVLIDREADREPDSDDALRLSAFESVYEELSTSMTAVSAELEKLKASGREKTVRYKELFGQKLMNNYIKSLFERHGITFDNADFSESHRSRT